MTSHSCNCASLRLYRTLFLSVRQQLLASIDEAMMVYCSLLSDAGGFGGAPDLGGGLPYIAGGARLLTGKPLNRSFKPRTVSKL